MADRFVSALATAGSGTEVDPWTLAEAETDVALSGAGTFQRGDRLLVKADGLYSTGTISWVYAGATDNYNFMEGYSGIAGDGGRATIQHSGGGGDLFVFASYWQVSNFILDGDSVASDCIQAPSEVNYHVNIEAKNGNASGINHGICERCYSHDNNQYGFSQGTVINCISENNGSGGFFSPAAITNSVSKDETRSLVEPPGIVSGSVFENTRLDIDRGYVLNSIFIDAPAEAVRYSSDRYSRVVNCNFYNNDSKTNSHDDLLIDEKELDPQFTDTANLDYTRTGDNLDDLGLNIIGLVAGVDYRIDIGPFQGLAHYPTAITGDPFTAVYDTLWSILEDSSDFTGRVDKGNRIKYRGRRKPKDPEKDTVSTDDMPEVRIVAGGMTPHLQNTSSSCRMTTKYSIEVRSGTKDLRVAHYPIVWSIYRAMASWAIRLTALTWNDKAYVVLNRPIGDIAEGIERGEVSEGIEGWFGIWTIEVDCWFTTSDL